jgi:RNA polymerase sigma-70 factor (ECF subfamily)
VEADEDRADVEQLMRGDLSAFDRLFAKYRERVFRVCYANCGSREDALDATQETFIKLYERLDRYDGRSAFRTWLYRVASNSARDRRRSRGRRERLHRGQVHVRPVAGGGDEDRVDAGDAVAAVRRAMADLPEKQRTVLRLSAMAGLTYREIAAVVGCRIGTVMSRLHYARERLRAVLGPAFGGGPEEA